MRVEGEEAGARVREWLESHRVPFEVVESPRSSSAPLTLFERRSGKSITFALGAVREAEEIMNPGTRTNVLSVLLDDGRRFGLAGVGFVFAPSFLATGPLPECPAATCFLDFEKLFRHLDHLVSDHHEGHEIESLQVLAVLLASLEGARLLGIDVAKEERALDRVLKQLEGVGASLSRPGTGGAKNT